MKVLWYLAVPFILVTVYCLVIWARNRKPTSLQSGVESFRREMRALSPEPIEDERAPQARPSVASPARRTGSPQRRR